jgi:hypothetical protein
VRVIGTLIIIILAGLPVLFAGWPDKSPAVFSSLVHGVPGSIAAMSLLLAVFVVLAAVCGVIARNKGEAGR